jgi:predicted RNA-binding Zn-ribbon protein involved in translation (DUF1610 family)
MCRKCVADKKTNKETARRVLILHDCGLPITKVGKTLGLSRQRVDQIYKRERGRCWAEERKEKKEKETLEIIKRLEERKNRVKFTCKYCGEPILWKDAGARRVYCSRPCIVSFKSIVKRSKKPKVCAGCGIKFFPWTTTPNQKFHDQKCYYKNGLNRKKKSKGAIP